MTMVPDNELHERIKKKLQQIFDRCRSITLRLAKLSDDLTEVIGVASGFLVEIEGNHYLISAGHALEKGKWIIETDLINEDIGRAACIPINAPWTTKKITLKDGKLEDVDFAWAKVDLNEFKRFVQNETRLKGKQFIFNIYNGPLGDEPEEHMPHSYVSLNQATIISAIGPKILERDASYELEMFYKGIKNDDGLYVFSIPRHKGHEYYKGASGSPIVTPSGKIVSILLAGCESKNELYGLPLANFAKLIPIIQEEG